MKLGGRLAAAIEVLEEIGGRHRPAADALRDWGLSHRFAGAGDRGAVGNIVYDALRRRRSACWLLEAETPRAMAFGALLLEWGETAETLAAAIADDRHAPAPLSQAERAAAVRRRMIDAPPEIRADLPDWTVPLVRRTFGDAWADEGAALAGRPPLDLRVNPLAATRTKVLGALAELGAATAPLARDGLRIPPIERGGRHPNVQAEPAFQLGQFEVQDEGSQIAAELAGASPGMEVLDFCAGAGGKTLAMAAAMQNRGRIIAYDAEKARLAPIFDRLRRSGATNVDVASRPAELAPLRTAADLVLVDAPCTGSGTWRRRPDAKWRLSAKQLDVRRAEQARILDEAKGFVKSGGRLVYVTCSVFEEENGDQVAHFLQANPAFSPVDHKALFERHFPGKATRARFGPAGILLSPLRTGTDGFGIAVLRRAG